MSHYKAAFTAGIAMFAMFFGSGNLVFPLIIGMQSTDQYLYAGLGLMITGVIVPFIGLFGMILYQGNKDKYFGLLGKYAPFTLSILILSLIGPFGVVPRCILVSYGGISLLFPQMPLYLFSLIFLVLVVFILWRKEDIIPIVGKVLGPLKIGGIILIILAAIWQSPQLVPLEQLDSALILGLTQGYQTMDLMASFFFSVVIVEYLSRLCKTKQETLKVSLLATSIGALCIAGVYFGLLSLGAHYATDLANVNEEQYLATIAKLTLGHNAAWIVSITIFLSCLATGATLVRLFSEFLRSDISKEKISWHNSVYITIAISFVLSLMGFTTIITFLHYILTYAYPALITLSITAILQYFYGFKWSKLAFFAVLFITALYKTVSCFI